MHHPKNIFDLENDRLDAIMKAHNRQQAQADRTSRRLMRVAAGLVVTVLLIIIGIVLTLIFS